ncbi:MAG: hypothetical protein SGCHY_002406 [Lobulomycetales sp.]
MIANAGGAGRKVKGRGSKNKQLSPEVNSMLKGMMQSSKLSMGQQRFLDSFITGDKPSLPPASLQPKLYMPQSRRSAAGSSLHARPHQRRTLETMIAQDAFKPERYIAPGLKQGRDRAHEIERLSDSMSKSGGDSLLAFQPSQSAVQTELASDSEEEEIDEVLLLKKEIIERSDWLEEMRRLGQGEKYEQQVSSEIAVRMKRLREIQ